MRIVIALLSVIVASCAWAQTTAPATRLSPDVLPGLIRQLMSDDWQTRGNAKSRLIDIGEPAMPALKKLSSETGDEEARFLAESAMQQIEENTRLSPTLISLHIKNTLADKVWKEIARQVGDRHIEEMAAGDANLSMEVTVDVDRQPFWAVVKEICRQSVTTPYATEDNRISLTNTATDGPFGMRMSVNAGPVMIMPHSITVNRTVDLGARIPQSTARLSMHVFIDPKFRLAEDVRLQIDKMVDDKGNSLLSDEPSEDEWNENENAGWLWFGSIPFKDTRNGGARIARLSGSATLRLELDSADWEINRPLNAAGASRTIAGRKYTLSGFKKGRENCAAILTVEIPAGLDNQQRRIAEYRDRVRLLDRDGRPWELFTQKPVEEATTPIRRAFEYVWLPAAEAGSPAKLVIHVPSDLREITVPFEFKDLPLP